MNGVIIIPDHIPDQINKDLDKLRDSLPESARSIFEGERDVHYQEIINFIADKGYYPEIAGVEKSNDR